MDISVIVCTRNRAQQLSELLASMCELTPPKVAWEFIVVDNGSTDNTSDVVDSFRNALPVRRVLQPVPGLSNARNTGVDAALGCYIIWTDDDVHVGSNWLAAYIEAFNRWPDAAVFGGKITPVLQSPTPGWFQRGVKYLDSLLCVRHLGDTPLPLSIIDNCVPYGANYAVRAAEQKQYHYDPALGVAPGRRMGGEEIDVIQRILESGKGGWWVPQVEVEHVIPSSRQTISYIIQFYEGLGEYDVYKAVKKGTHQVAAVLRLAITLPASFVRYYLARALGLSTWVFFLTIYAHKRGMFRAWFSFGVTRRQRLMEVDARSTASSSRPRRRH